MSSENGEPSERVLTMIGVGAAVMQLVAFTAVGVMTLGSTPYSLIIGGLSGAGAFLFLPWFLSLSAAQEEADEGLGPATERISRNSGPGLFGLGLESGAIVMLAVGMALGPDLLLGVASGLTVAVGAYLVGSMLLGR